VDVEPRRPELPHERASEEHFLRRKVSPRRVSRRRLPSALRWAGAGVGLIVVGVIGYWTASAAGRAPELVVSRIRVVGNERLAEGEILRALGLRSDSNILSLDLDGLKQQLLRSPWIKDVQLTRVLPATLTLRVVERAPVGIAVLDGLYLIDEEGTFLDEMSSRYAELALPLVRGMSDENGRLVEARAFLAGRVLEALAEEPRLAPVVSEIDVSNDAGSIRVVLRHPPVMLLVREENLVDRLMEIVPLTEDITRHFPSVKAVDLRFQGRVYLQLDGMDGQAGDIGGR